LRQTRVLELISWKKTLIPHIMQRQYGAHPLDILPILRNGIEIDRTERCLPIMEMEDVGIPSAHSFEIGHHFDRRSAEKRKPIEIVGIVDTAILIEPWPIKEGFVPNRPYPNPAITWADGKNTFLNRRINKPFRRGYSYPTDGMEGSARVSQATIVWEKENDVMAKLRQLKRQRAGNIGKPTGLRIGDRFRGDHE